MIWIKDEDERDMEVYPVLDLGCMYTIDSAESNPYREHLVIGHCRQRRQDWLIMIAWAMGNGVSRHRLLLGDPHGDEKKHPWGAEGLRKAAKALRNYVSEHNSPEYAQIINLDSLSKMADTLEYEASINEK